MKTHIAIVALGAVALAGCAGMAVAQGAAGVDDLANAEAAAAEAPPAPPPGMPQPITMAQRAGATGGEAKYVEYCIMCHGPVGMGTGLIARRGTPMPAQLELRENLPAAFVVAAARNGIGNMPAIPRGEVSDEDLQAIADYLAAGPHGAEQ